MAVIDTSRIADFEALTAEEIEAKTAWFFKIKPTGNHLIEIERCRRSFAYFLHYLRIPDANKGLIPYTLWPYLVAIAMDWQEGGNWVEGKARQLGYSWLLAAYDDWIGTFRDHARILSFSINQRESSELLEKVVSLNEGLPDWLRKDLVSESKSEIEWSGTAAKMMALPATGEGGRSFTATLVQTDEWAFHQNASTHYGAYRAAIADGGQHIGISTGNGVGNLFASFMLSTDPESGYRRRFNPWSSRPDRDEVWYQKELRAYMQRVLDPNSPEFGKHPKLFYRENPSKLEDVFQTFVGLVYDIYDEALHVRKPPVEWRNTKWRFAGVDPGQGDPGAINILGESDKGQAHNYGEFHFPGVLDEDSITVALMKWHAVKPFHGIAVDGNEGTLISTLVSRGLPAFAANKERSTGIGHVYGRLMANTLSISEACTWTRTEFGQYRWRETTAPGEGDSWLTSTPVEHHGDHLDGLRYAAIALAQAKSQAGHLPSMGQQPEFNPTLELMRRGKSPRMKWVTEDDGKAGWQDAGVKPKPAPTKRGPSWNRRLGQPDLRRMTGARRR